MASRYEVRPYKGGVGIYDTQLNRFNGKLREEFDPADVAETLNRREDERIERISRQLNDILSTFEEQLND